MAETFVQWVGLYLLTLASVCALTIFLGLKLFAVLADHLARVHKQNDEIVQLLRFVMHRLE